GGAKRSRGGAGPMMIETCAADNPLYTAFLRSGEQAGYLHVQDHNAFRQEGVHVTQRNVHNGLRWSTSQAYLHAQGKRENLHVFCNTVVPGVGWGGAGGAGGTLLAQGHACALR